MVIEERCIACGNCFKVCAQKAKRIEHSVAEVQAMLAGGERVIACLAPSFPAAFDTVSPGRIVSALKATGFREVWEVAFGAELVSREYVRLFKASRATGARVVTTPCPAIVSYVEKYMPSLIGALAPIVSPMVAAARAVRRRCGPEVRVVFIGPCVAKKNEIREASVAGDVDAVLTYAEQAEMFEAAGVKPEAMSEGEFDSPPCSLARSFAISGGLLRTAGLSSDILENEIMVTEGKDRVLAALKELAHGRRSARLFDVLFCEGCINGPKMPNNLGILARKEILADFVNQRRHRVPAAEMDHVLAEFEGLDLSRSFTRQKLSLLQPSEEEITRALQAVRKFHPEDQLNCGACGYPSCRDKAIAVCQGLAEIEMCLPYLVEALEDTCRQLRESHRELASAQDRLVHAERLASMGQLSAGVAHEINNPLCTVLMYSHILLRELQKDSRHRQDLEMIVNEANRCKGIVRGLLDFARQSRVNKEPTDIGQLVDSVFEAGRPSAQLKGVRLRGDIQPDLPQMMIDRTQMSQALLNLVRNGVDATDAGGEVRIAVSLGDNKLRIDVADNGHGIPEEHRSRLFTPFFTTKEREKGTGLGLAIVYGVVKMHYGDITVESEEGKGTTFHIQLPLEQTPADGAADPALFADSR